MNAASDLLESRMEVQFFDKFNLLGQGTIDRGGGGDQKGESPRSILSYHTLTYLKVTHTIIYYIVPFYPAMPHRTVLQCY